MKEVGIFFEAPWHR